MIFGELSGAPTWVPAVLLVTLSLVLGFLARFIPVSYTHLTLPTSDLV